MRHVGVQRANIEFRLFSSLLLLTSRDPNFKSHLEFKKWFQPSDFEPGKLADVTRMVQQLSVLLNSPHNMPSEISLVSLWANEQRIKLTDKILHKTITWVGWVELYTKRLHQPRNL